MSAQSSTAPTIGQLILADTRTLREEVGALKAAALLLTTPQADQEVSTFETMLRTLSAILDAISELQMSVAALHTKQVEVKLGRTLREIMNDQD